MKEKIKKMLQWFRSPPNKEFEALSFRKDEAGNDIFFPWGYPGDSLLYRRKTKEDFFHF